MTIGSVVYFNTKSGIFDTRSHASTTSGFTSASNQIIKDITYFRNYLDSIGEQGKPIWVTETGLLMSKINANSPESSYDSYWTSFLKPIIEFMDSSHKVQRVFPYVTAPRNDPYTAQHFPGGIFWMQEKGTATPTSITDMNALARDYAGFISQHQDKTPPIVNINSYDQINHTAEVLLGDGGQEQSGIIGFSWTEAADENNLGSWSYVPTFKNNFDLVIPGNQSETVKLALSQTAATGTPASSSEPVPPPAGQCQTFYRDADGDGYGLLSDSKQVCGAGSLSGYTTNSGDCADTNANVHPGSTMCSSQSFSDKNGQTSWDYDCSGDLGRPCGDQFDYTCDTVSVVNRSCSHNQCQSNDVFGYNKRTASAACGTQSCKCVKTSQRGSQCNDNGNTNCRIQAKSSYCSQVTAGSQACN